MLSRAHNRLGHGKGCVGGSGWRLRGCWVVVVVVVSPPSVAAGFVFHLFSFVVSKAGSLAQPGGNTQPALGTARSPRPLLPPRAETPGWSWRAGPRGVICPACLASSHPSCACPQCSPSPCPGASTSLPPLKCPPPLHRQIQGREELEIACFQDPAAGKCPFPSPFSF